LGLIEGISDFPRRINEVDESEDIETRVLGKLDSTGRIVETRIDRRSMEIPRTSAQAESVPAGGNEIQTGGPGPG
jgi:hypothetical protein